jgi:hypothetical protein
MIELLVAALVGAVCYFVVGWLVFELILGKYMSANMVQVPGFLKSDKESSMMWLFVSCTSYSLLLTLVFTQWTTTSTSIEGATIGAVVGGLISVMTSTYWWATSHLFSNFKPILADVVAAMITVGLMGGVIAGTIGLL